MAKTGNSRSGRRGVSKEGAIADCGLRIGDSRYEIRDTNHEIRETALPACTLVRKTKPIFGVLGAKIGVGGRGKANLASSKGWKTLETGQSQAGRSGLQDGAKCDGFEYRNRTNEANFAISGLQMGVWQRNKPNGPGWREWPGWAIMPRLSIYRRIRHG